jgi:hypothetical protein
MEAFLACIVPENSEAPAHDMVALGTCERVRGQE